MRKQLLLIAFAILITGCAGTKPILNLQNEPVPTFVDVDNLTLEEVEEAILTAATQRGWSSVVAEPNLIEATLARKGYEAIINIAYTDKQYSINYKSSDNLKYKNGNIHRNYNRWIANLSKSIQERVKYVSTLTGEEAIIKTRNGISIREIDNERVVNIAKMFVGGKGLTSILLTEGKHSVGIFIRGYIQKRINNIEFKAKHEYLIDYIIQDDAAYVWVKDLTDNVVVWGKEVK